VRFDQQNQRPEQKINMRIIFISEVIDKNTLSIDLYQIQQIFDDSKSEIIIILSDTQFKIIDGKYITIAN
jgi:hypothetical protein